MSAVNHGYLMELLIAALPNPRAIKKINTSADGVTFSYYDTEYQISGISGEFVIEVKTTEGYQTSFETMLMTRLIKLAKELI